MVKLEYKRINNQFNKDNLLKMSQHCEGLISDNNGFKELFETCEFK